MWYNKLYVAARRGQLVIAGFTYVASYRVELDMSCDLNFLTGAGVVNGRKVRVSKAGRGFAQATELALTQECGDIAAKLTK